MTLTRRSSVPKIALRESSRHSAGDLWLSRDHPAASPPMAGAIAAARAGCAQRRCAKSPLALPGRRSIIRQLDRKAERCAATIEALDRRAGSSAPRTRHHRRSQVAPKSASPRRRRRQEWRRHGRQSISPPQPHAPLNMKEYRAITASWHVRANRRAETPATSVGLAGACLAVTSKCDGQRARAAKSAWRRA